MIAELIAAAEAAHAEHVAAVCLVCCESPCSCAGDPRFANRGQRLAETGESIDRRKRMELLISALVALVGLLMHAYAANPKLQEIGRIMFFCGLFVALLTVGPEWVKLFPR